MKTSSVTRWLTGVASMAALVAVVVAGCGGDDEPMIGVDEIGGYVEVNGEKKYLGSAADQWDGLGAGDYDPEPVFGQTLPDVVDHAAFQTPIRDQQSNYTCVDFATVAGMEAFAYFQPMANDLSEAHLASLHQAKTLQATLQAAASAKLTIEADWPSGAPAGKAGWQADALYGILDWKAILDPTNIESLRARLAEGDKVNVVLSMSLVAQSWQNNGIVVPKPGETNKDWAHAVLLVGYKKMPDSNLQPKWFFHIKNSWGTGWGGSNLGYGWLSEDYVKSHALQAAVVRSVTSSVPGGSCTPNASLGCFNNDLYHFDSCNSPGAKAQDCDDNNPCTTNGCKNAACQNLPLQNGTACGGDKTCENGTCKSTCTPKASAQCSGGDLYYFDSCGQKGALAESCDDGNACTTNSCAQGACQHLNASNSTPCGSGDVCQNGTCSQCLPNASNKCVNGDVVSFDSCGAQGALVQDCDDQNLCTSDGCASGACMHTPLQDGTACGGNKVCSGSACGCLPGASKTCVGGNSYWLDSCGGQGPLAEGCDDHNPCTVDDCSSGACTHANAPNGQTCAAGKVCAQGACVAPGCNANASKACFNGNVYWFDSCYTPGALATSCDDANPCTTDTCPSQVCVHTPLADSTVCGVGQVCTAGICGAPACAPTANTTCMNGNSYHVDSCGKAGALAEACDDGNACTTDSCPGQTCQHTPLPDNASCGTNQVCFSGVCSTCTPNTSKKCVGGNLVWFDSCNVQGALAQSCDDGNICTTDICASAACQNTPVPNNTPCGGSNVCTSGQCGAPPCTSNASKKCYGNDLYWYDSCNVVGSLAQSCNDGNACTTDSCSGTSCQNTPLANGTSCGAGKTCSGGVCGDACNNGICASTENPVSCPADCNPAFIDVQQLGTMASGGCATATDGWHFAGGIVYWTFGTTCSTPSTSSPASYGSELAQWHFDIKKTGTYNVSFKIPPTGAACGFASTKYTTGARYALVNGGTGQSAVVNQRSAIGTEVVAFSNVHLVAGPLYLYLYDSVTDLSNCCSSCGQSIRVFLDYANVTWVGP